MLNNDKLILIFGLNKEKEELLSKVIRQEGLPDYKVITPDMCSMAVKDIVAGLKFQIHTEELSNEQVVLFNNFTDDELDKGIRAVKTSLTPMPILAVVTPTSLEWTFKDLLGHLIEEREWFRAQKRGAKSE